MNVYMGFCPVEGGGRETKKWSGARARRRHGGGDEATKGLLSAGCVKDPCLRHTHGTPVCATHNAPALTRLHTSSRPFNTTVQKRQKNRTDSGLVGALGRRRGRRGTLSGRLLLRGLLLRGLLLLLGLLLAAAAAGRRERRDGDQRDRAAADEQAALVVAPVAGAGRRRLDRRRQLDGRDDGRVL